MRKPAAVWALLALVFCGAVRGQPDRPSVRREQLTRLEAAAVALLTAKSRDDRRDAVRILGALRSPRSLSVLSDLARKDREVAVREEAVRALGRLENPGVVTVLAAV